MEINKIYNESCFDTMARMSDKFIDLVVTDPPYGVDLEYDSYDDTEENWKDMFCRLVPEVKRISKMVIMPSCRIKMLPFIYEKHPPDWLICWYKGSPGHSAYIGFNDWEPLLVYGKKEGLQMHDYFQTTNIEKMGNYGHPCPKPLKYSKWLVVKASDEGDLIYDPFMGSLNANVGANKNDEANRRDKPTITNFCTKCNAWRGELGSEPQFQDFVRHICQIFSEIKRVLKPTGTCFVNLGDTFNGTKVGNDDSKNKNANTDCFRKDRIGNIGNKSLLMIPERFAMGMIDSGWILRNQIIWHKPNQMPSSATDRFTVDFEKIFFFVKQGNYYFEQQLEKSIWAEFDKRSHINGGVKSNGKTATGQYATNKVAYTDGGMRNMRTVWSINTEGCSDAHFATYPQRLVERMIKCGCPEGGLVLDPFFGSGTTGIYARKCHRNYLGIEFNPKYIKIAENRLYKEIGMFL